MSLYILSEWDHEEQQWDEVARAASLFALRRDILRSPFLDRQRFRDSPGLLVQREGDELGTRRRTKVTQLPLFTEAP